MTSPQAGVFASNDRYQYHLEFSVGPSTDKNAVREALRTALANTETAQSDGPIETVLSFGPELWSCFSSDMKPTGLEDFQSIAGPKHHAPATQGDLWIWIQSDQHDRNWELAHDIRRSMPSGVKLTLDQPTFVYKNSLDLMGFVDGTANPKGDARFPVAQIPDGSPGAGGSLALTQRWVHDLESFEQLTIEQQALIIGRTKIEDEELQGDEMPPDSHVSRTDVSVDGIAQKIWRRSTPFGDTKEHGLHFVAFACEQSRFQIQLERMFGVTDDGMRDRITDFSMAVTGSYWFTPCVEDLQHTLRT
ncbi:MAG: putative iron-dependent peroxidase [Planctomycetota bacterium]|jgi:putative iron-dependent peroxidase